jgi:nucleoid-associated protein EbfC
MPEVDMFKLLKQAREMQAQMKKVQEELKDKSIQIDCQGVRIAMNGKQEVQSVTIAPEILAGASVEKLEKIFLRAFNEAITKSQDLMAAEMKKISGGMNIPGLT